MLNVSSISIDYDHADGLFSAPRSIVIWGLAEDNDTVVQSEIQNDVQQRLHRHLTPDIVHPFPDSERFVPLTMLEYNPHLAARQQFFSVFREVQGLGSPVGIVVLQILSNWGGHTTRLCQVGVHGVPVDT